MEDDVPCHVWSRNSDNVSNIFQNDQAKWKIFPEKSSICVQFHKHLTLWSVFEILTLEGEHWERNSLISLVGVEDSL